LHPPGVLAGAVQRRQKDGQQYGDDADDDQEFDLARI
jgi:hypothetical protein